MGKVLRLTFAALFWALDIVLAHILQQVTQPAGLASLNHGTLVQQWQVRFNLTEEVSPPSIFPSSCIIYLCDTPARLRTPPPSPDPALISP